MSAVYSYSDVAKHNTKNDGWVVIKNKHPGGRSVLLENCGGDATEAFINNFHSTDAFILLQKFEIGTIKESEKKPPVNFKQAKTITLEELKKHNTQDSMWMSIHNKHPGGDDVLLENAGTLATTAFEDIGHSEDAREMMSPYFIGFLEDEHKETTETHKLASDDSNKFMMYYMLVPVAILACAAVLYKVIS